jgi:hypothetical protein
MYRRMASEPAVLPSLDHLSPDDGSDRTITTKAGLFPEFVHLADAIGTDIAENSTLDEPAHHWYALEFEEELFRSSVYSRSARRTASLSTISSTLTGNTCSILAHLSLADVSITSVLRLPIKIGTLTNKSTYVAQQNASKAEAESDGVTTSWSIPTKPLPAHGIHRIDVTQPSNEDSTTCDRLVNTGEATVKDGHDQDCWLPRRDSPFGTSRIMSIYRAEKLYEYTNEKRFGPVSSRGRLEKRLGIGKNEFFDSTHARDHPSGTSWNMFNSPAEKLYRHANETRFGPVPVAVLRPGRGAGTEEFVESARRYPPVSMRNRWLPDG